MLYLRRFLAVALGEGATQIRVRTKVQRRQPFLVFDGQIGSVGGEEAGDRGR